MPARNKGWITLRRGLDSDPLAGAPWISVPIARHALLCGVPGFAYHREVLFFWNTARISDKHWSLSHVATGKEAGSGRTMREALENAENFVRRGAETLRCSPQDCISRAIARERPLEV